MRISDWSSDVCSSDLRNRHAGFACGYYTIDVSELAQRLATRQARGFEGVRCNDEAAVQRGAGYPNPRGSRCSQLRYVDVVRDDWTRRHEPGCRPAFECCFANNHDSPTGSIKDK